MFKKILLAADGSECSQKAAVIAASLARKYDSELTALNVFAIPANVTMAGAGDMIAAGYNAAAIDEWAEGQKRAVASGIARVLEDAGEDDLPCTVLQEIGHPADTIVRVAREEGIDLIVMGSRGLGGFSRLLLGSVSTAVSHHAPCSVLIVRQQ